MRDGGLASRARGEARQGVVGVGGVLERRVHGGGARRSKKKGGVGGVCRRGSPIKTIYSPEANRISRIRKG